MNIDSRKLRNNGPKNTTKIKSKLDRGVVLEDVSCCTTATTLGACFECLMMGVMLLDGEKVLSPSPYFFWNVRGCIQLREHPRNNFNSYVIASRKSEIDQGQLESDCLWSEYDEQRCRHITSINVIILIVYCLL